MSHILIKFLISIFILNISYGIDFNTWTENSKNIIFNSKSIVKSIANVCNEQAKASKAGQMHANSLQK